MFSACADSFANLRAFLQALLSLKFKTTTMGLFAQVDPMTFAFMLVAIALLVVSYRLPRDCRFVTRRGQLLFLLAGLAAIVFLAMPSGGEFIYFKF